MEKGFLERSHVLAKGFRTTSKTRDIVCRAQKSESCRSLSSMRAPTQAIAVLFFLTARIVGGAEDIILRHGTKTPE